MKRIVVLLFAALLAWVPAVSAEEVPPHLWDDLDGDGSSDQEQIREANPPQQPTEIVEIELPDTPE